MAQQHFTATKPSNITDLMRRKPVGSRKIMFEHDGRGRYWDFPNSSVSVSRLEGGAWRVDHRADWRHPTKTFLSPLAAFNYARSTLAA